MNEPIDRIAHLFEKLKTYITLQIEIASLTAGEKAAQLLAKLLSGGAIVFFAVFFFLFAGLSSGFALGACLGSYAIGFLLIAAFYLLIAVVIILCKHKYIEKSLTDVFIKMLFKKNQGDKSDE
ncbi:MAG: phage holin family protein [Prevotellaceae bacterium]|jgi:hypothetical protein|nr:phage holin family protein [Prevotellaceae bacterium]